MLRPKLRRREDSLQKPSRKRIGGLQARRARVGATCCVVWQCPRSRCRLIRGDTFLTPSTETTKMSTTSNNPDKTQEKQSQQTYGIETIPIR